MKVKDKDYTQIGDLAKSLGITTRTIRYYEEIGLMTPPQRLEGGIRVYYKEDVIRLKFILKLKELGITLKEMQELAHIHEAKQDTAETLSRLLEMLDNHISHIDEKIAKVTSLRRDLTDYRSKVVDRIQHQD